MEVKIGMFINDRYEILEKVGSGGMADVYKAKCHRLNRYVAIKILKQEYAQDKNFVQKFRGEAQSAAGLSHPNIVNVYDVGEDNGLYFIVMELVEGITLKRFIERKAKSKEGHLSARETLGISIQIAQGMEAAHAKHIIHRDIKPQNIIISREGKVKVTDFGIAKAASSNTVTQNALGSVHYLSPEMARGGYSDTRSDIYSLGVTMYEMLTGRVPFSGDNTVSVALLHIQGEAEPIHNIVPDVPESLEKIVEKCMQKKPDRRYQTASELITDLKLSINNPNGSFVTLNSSVPDSPTRQMTKEQMQEINAATLSSSISDVLDDDVKVKKSRTKHDEDDDDIDSMNSGLEKILTVGSVFAVILVGVAVLYIVANYLDIFKGIFDPKSFIVDTPTPIQVITNTPAIDATPTPEPELVRMPKVVGLKDSDAVDSLYQISRTFSIKYAEEFSSEFESGQVIAQYPPENAQINPFAAITLTISVGKETNTIPKVYNYTLSVARQALTDKGYKVVVEYEYNNVVDEGNVIRTEPEAYSVVEDGSTVTVFVSLGVNNTKVEVPDLVGLTAAEAGDRLTEAELTLGSVEYDWSDEYEYGRVISQNVTPGTGAVINSAVDVILSKGPNPDPTPTPTPDPTPTPAEKPGGDNGESTEPGQGSGENGSEP